MAEAKVDDRIVKAIVGHKPTDITEHYTHFALETLLDAVNRI
jgi:intergrase/recombinase